MPVYDYKCKDHGMFHELATMECSAAPCQCPQCGALSPRVVLISPEVLAMAPDQRKAHETNERASHEPILSTSESRAEAAHQHQGCGCHGHKKIIHPEMVPETSALKQQVVYLADGSKVFPSQRPWMISH